MELQQIANCRVSTTAPISLKNMLCQQRPSAQNCFPAQAVSRIVRKQYYQQADSSIFSNLIEGLPALIAVVLALIAELPVLIAVLLALTAVKPALTEKALSV